MSDLTPEQFAALNEFGEADAQANYFLSVPPEFAKPFRLEVKRIGSMWVTMIPEFDHPLYNRILGLGVGEPATESILEEAIAFLKSAGCTNYIAQISPLAQPAQLPEWLATRGFKPGRNWAKMYRGNEPAQAISTDLRVEKIGKDQADAFADVVLPAFDIPPAGRPMAKGAVGQPGWHHYLAFAGEKPASAAAMFISGEVGWYGFAGTLKAYRKRGGQGALLARLIEDGRALGCQWFVAETGEDTPEDPNPSCRNMLRSGFKLAYLRRNYVHLSPMNPVRQVRRALLVAAYSLIFGWQRLQRSGK